MDNHKIDLIRLDDIIKDAEKLPEEPKNDTKLHAKFYGPQYLFNYIDNAIRLSTELFGRINIHNQNLNKIRRLNYDTARKALLSELIDMKEEISGFNYPEKNSFVLDWSNIHRIIVDVSKDRFEKDLFADSVESAFKEINNQVKKIIKDKTSEEVDGSKLMFKAFSNEHPLIILDDLTTLSGKNIQEGYMHLFAGAILAIRNPHAHEVGTISKEDAMHFIVLASLLMNKLDKRN